MYVYLIVRLQWWRLDWTRAWSLCCYRWEHPASGLCQSLCYWSKLIIPAVWGHHSDTECNTGLTWIRFFIASDSWKRSMRSVWVANCVFVLWNNNLQLPAAVVFPPKKQKLEHFPSQRDLFTTITGSISGGCLQEFIFPEYFLSKTHLCRISFFHP